MIFPLTLQGQEDKYTLLTEPYVKRPVSMHKGQIQMNGAYRLSVTNGYFEADGSKTDLVTDGRAVVGHRYTLDMHYGILEFLEAGVAIDFFKQGIRSRTISYFEIQNSLQKELDVYEITERRGLGDLWFSATVRLPFDIQYFDFGLTGYYALPVSEHQPEKPEHSFTMVNPDGTWNIIQYHFKEKYGTGVPQYGMGGVIKLRLSRIAIEAMGAILIPQEPGMNSYWTSELIGQTFTYHKSEYQYLPQNLSTGSISLHFQPVEWMHVYSEGYYALHYGGWFEQNNQRYAYPVLKYYSLNLGMEIVVTPTLRIHEFIALPLKGENGYANLFIHTGISLNLIPF